MKNYIVVAATLAIVSMISVSLAADELVVGKWLSEPGNTGRRAQVQIEPCGDKLCGIIIGALDSEGALEVTYEHLGKQMIKGMKKKGPGSYVGGTIWAPDKNKIYKSSMTLADNGKLIVKGCLAFICRSQAWTRLN